MFFNQKGGVNTVFFKLFSLQIGLTGKIFAYFNYFSTASGGKDTFIAKWTTLIRESYLCKYKAMGIGINFDCIAFTEFPCQ